MPALHHRCDCHAGLGQRGSGRGRRWPPGPCPHFVVSAQGRPTTRWPQVGCAAEASGWLSRCSLAQVTFNQSWSVEPIELIGPRWPSVLLSGRRADQPVHPPRGTAALSRRCRRCSTASPTRTWTAADMPQACTSTSTKTTPPRLYTAAVPISPRIALLPGVRHGCCPRRCRNPASPPILPARPRCPNRTQGPSSACALTRGRASASPETALPADIQAGERPTAAPSL